MRSQSGSRRPTVTVIRAEGPTLTRILDSSHLFDTTGLDRPAYGRLDAVEMNTAWGRSCRRRFALVDGNRVLASATRYRLSAVLDARGVPACAIGSVVVDPAHGGAGHAETLVERLLDDEADAGTEVALLFSSDMDPGWCLRAGFARVPLTELELTVLESSRRGAPMTLVRAGEERDLAAIVAMGQVRAEPFRFHLHRDASFVQHAIIRKRLLAGLGTAGARQLHFFIAEEGVTAAAYVVVSIVGGAWTIEECGDRDPSGARVGAILQALIAREPVERRPSIRGRLPSGFVPPQVTISAATPSTDMMMAASLASGALRPPLTSGDVLYWRSDMF